MKLKKILLQIGLLLTLVGIGVMGTLVAQAASIPAGAQAVNMTDGNVYQVQSPGTTVPDSDNGGYTTGTYPRITAIAANNIDPVTKRITSKTTKIYILFADKIIAKNNDKYTAIYPQVMTDGGVSVASTQPKSLTISSDGSNSVNMPATYQEVDVDLSDLANKLPLYVGFKYTVAYQYGGDPSYYFGQIKADATASNAWKTITINDGNDMASASTVVKGTGEPGLTATLSGVSGSAGQYSTTINTDGTYSIDLGGSSLKDLGNPSTIKVTESNDLGDSKSATANVVDTVPLTTTVTTSPVAVDPDTLSGNITGKSDAEILKWLSGQSAAGLTTTKQGLTTALTADTDGLTYTADTTDLASKIAAATATNPLTINVSASDSAGDKTESTTPIEIYTTNGNFKFNSLNDLAFGTLPVPAQETLFAPTNTPTILIDDTQTVGKDWYVTANASKMTDSANNDLNGNMVYVDADGVKHDLTNNTTLVGQGQRESGKTTAEVADGWADAGDAVPASKFVNNQATGVTKGIYLDAQPSIYSGGVASGTTYNGQISWTLTNSVSGS